MVPEITKPAHHQLRNVHDRLGTQDVIVPVEDYSIHYLVGVRVGQERVVVLHPRVGIRVREKHVAREHRMNPLDGGLEISCKPSA